MKKIIVLLIVCSLLMFIVGCNNGYKSLDTKIYVLGNEYNEKNNIEEVMFNEEILKKYFSDEKYFIIDSNEKYNEFIKLLYNNQEKYIDEEKFFENNNKFIIYRDATSSNYIKFKYTYDFTKSLFHTYHIHENELGDDAMYKCIDVVDVEKKYGDIFYDYFHKGK